MKPVRDPWWNDVVSAETAKMYRDLAFDARGEIDSDVVAVLLWGDRVTTGETSADGAWTRVEGRDKRGWVRTSYLGGDPLLELYVIDVGQGDGLLVITPEGHTIMIDGGETRQKQVTGKNAADFVDWKFCNDFLTQAQQRVKTNRRITLDAVIASHCDQDHFGGLWNLLDRHDPSSTAELAAKSVTAERIYHAGLSWWHKPATPTKDAGRSLGRSSAGNYTQLLGDRSSCEAATVHLSAPDADTLAGNWGKFVKTLVDTVTAAGDPAPIERLSDKTGWLPGFAPDDPDSAVAIRVLGPVERSQGGKPALTRFDDGSKTTNGHSIALRIDYGKRRLLLTGDLNTKSQLELMATYGADFPKEWGCDVAKACHHGSEDVSYKFLAGLAPVATIISSGDGESHDHPRPQIISASGLTGRRKWSDDGHKLLMPLIYATEIARGASFSSVSALHVFDGPQPFVPGDDAATSRLSDDPTLHKHRLQLGRLDKRPSKYPRLTDAMVVDGLVYGLINVRTDGRKLLFASRKEVGQTWAVEVLTDTDISAAN